MSQQPFPPRDGSSTGASPSADTPSRRPSEERSNSEVHPGMPHAEVVATYVRANVRRYTRESITARLTTAGHSREAIEAAWATIDAEDASQGRRDRRGAVATFIGGAYVITWLAVTVAWLVADRGQVNSVVSVSGLFAAFLFLPGLIGFVSARRSRSLQRARIGTAVAFTFVPLLILVALAGTCVAIAPPTGYAS